MKSNCLCLGLISLLLLTWMALPIHAARKEKVYVIDVVGSTTLVVAPNKDATEGEEVEILGVTIPDRIPGPDQEGVNWGFTIRGSIKSSLVGQQVVIETDKRIEKAMTDWLTLEEAAQYLKIGKFTLYDLARKGKLPAHKMGKEWRFDAEELDKWMKQQGSASPDDGSQNSEIK